MDYSTGYNLIWFIFRHKSAELITGMIFLFAGIVGLIKKNYFYNLISDLLLKYKNIRFKDEMRIQYFVLAMCLLIIWGIVLTFNVLGWLDILNDFVASRIW